MTGPNISHRGIYRPSESIPVDHCREIEGKFAMTKRRHTQHVAPCLERVMN
jgi:hypothetical protein